MKALAMLFISRIPKEKVISFLLDATFFVLVKIFGKGVEEIQETIAKVQYETPKLSGPEKFNRVYKEFDQKLKKFPSWFKDTFIHVLVLRIKPEKVTEFIKEKLCAE